MVAIRPLTPADIPAAQRLRQQAGWNQSDDDWHRLLAWDRHGGWAAEIDGHVVGTTTVTTYGQRIAWVGMVLVDADVRRQGIGRALLTHALAELERRDVQTVALDSTPEGQPLYASLGFMAAFELERWRGAILQPRPHGDGQGQPTGAMTPEGATNRDPSDDAPVGARFIPPTTGEAIVRPLTAGDLPAVTAYDSRLFGVERGHILAALRAGRPAACFVAERAGTVVGYGLSRPGARAWHLGPLVADEPMTAEQITRAALLAAPTLEEHPELVIDIVRSNSHAVELAQGLGLAPVRRFIRMTRGAPPPVVDSDRLYTSAGPELG